MSPQKENPTLHFSSCLFILAAGILLLLFLDQWSKQLAVLHLKNAPSHELIPGVLELHYLENTGMAFGMLEGKRVFFLLLCLVFFAAAVYVFLRIPKNTYYLPILIILAFMTAGAAGNFIDRAFRGYVVDFIYISLIHFPIFNLADIYVTVSAVLLVLFVGLKYKEEDFAFLNPRKKG